MISAPAFYKGIPLARTYRVDWIGATGFSRLFAAAQYHQR